MRELVKVSVLSGSRSIGGNFVRVEDDEQAMIFDQGMRFDLMGRYYSGFVVPKGVAEMRELGILPKPEWYENAKGIYISHMHLDHLGALSNIPSEIDTYLPNLAIYEDLEEKWGASPTWLSLIPRKYYVQLQEHEPLKTDRNNVVALPVSHSAYPAFAFLYFGKDRTILYTGDFRISSFLTQEEFYKINEGESMLDFLSNNKDVKIDTLIIEGTNMGSNRIPLSPEEANDILRRVLPTSALILITLHALDLEYVYSLMNLASEYEKEFYVASAQTSKLLEKISELPLKPKLIEKYVDYLAPFEKVELNDVDENSIIAVSYREVVDLVRDLKTANAMPKGSVAIISEPEPQIEEASEYAVISNWFSRIGVQSYSLRVSGHYYPFEMGKILKVIKPKQVIPIHTERPELMKNIAKSV